MKSHVITFRISEEVYQTIVRKVENQKPYPQTVGNYCREIVKHSVMRQHISRAKRLELESKKGGE